MSDPARGWHLQGGQMSTLRTRGTGNVEIVVRKFRIDKYEVDADGEGHVNIASERFLDGLPAPPSFFSVIPNNPSAN
jgi:hypothetical protein